MPQVTGTGNGSATAVLLCLNLDPFSPLGPFRTGMGNWTPPKAKAKVGEPPREKVAKEAELQIRAVQ